MLFLFKGLVLKIFFVVEKYNTDLKGGITEPFRQGFSKT